NHSFLLPSDKINVQSLQQLKKRLQLLIKGRSTLAPLHLSEKQFTKFKTLNMQELIFWHGNQLLTGAPFFPGGIPPVLFFQWGNYFGVAKYVFVPEEKALKANVLVYFEDMQDRSLNQCVADYHKKLQLALGQQNKLLYQHRL